MHFHKICKLKINIKIKYFLVFSGYFLLRYLNVYIEIKSANYNESKM